MGSTAYQRRTRDRQWPDATRNCQPAASSAYLPSAACSTPKHANLQLDFPELTVSSATQSFQGRTSRDTTRRTKIPGRAKAIFEMWVLRAVPKS